MHCINLFAGKRGKGIGEKKEGFANSVLRKRKRKRGVKAYFFFAGKKNGGGWSSLFSNILLKR